MTASLEEVRNRWLKERNLYANLCEVVTRLLRREARIRGLDCIISHRTKKTDSFLRKVMRKNYADPYDEVTDKAGVRLVCTYSDTVARLEELVCCILEIVDREDKAAGLGHDEIG